MEKKQFKAESKRLLDLMINSIYTHKEIFLRELISNASDAIDKRYYNAAHSGMNRSDFFIRLCPNAEERTLTVSDNGCGMTAEQLESNLGTIAKSGTNEFRSEHGGEENIDIIGRFGVGFYSAFMVAKRIEVYSSADGVEANVWESSGEDGYTIKPCECEGIGTRIVLTLKDDTEDERYSEFLEEYRLSELVKKYSDYIRYPIKMQRSTEHTGEDGAAETAVEDETLNSMVPLWRKNKSELTTEQYNEFYKENFRDFEEPLMSLHVSAEGMLSYNALLYIPKHTPYDYYTKGYKRGLKLYANGVMIMDSCEELLPEYFGFVKGLVDSPDLSLNISREMLQHDRQLTAIANNLKKKIQAELLRMLRDEREKYDEFFREFGLAIKYGVYSDFGMNKEFLKELVMFHSADKNKLITLREYADSMKEGQKDIYYAAGDSLAHIMHLPQTELIRDKGYDILCMTDNVDEFAVRIMDSYDEKRFKSASDPDLDLATDEEKKQAEERTAESRELLDRLKAKLGGKVAEVKLSARLKTSLACITGEDGLSVEMYKVLKDMPNAKDIPHRFVLELNPEHAVFKRLADLTDDRLTDYAELIYNMALLTAGLEIENPAAFSEAVCRLM